MAPLARGGALSRWHLGVKIGSSPPIKIQKQHQTGDAAFALTPFREYVGSDDMFAVCRRVGKFQPMNAHPHCGREGYAFSGAAGLGQQRKTTSGLYPFNDTPGNRGLPGQRGRIQ